MVFQGIMPDTSITKISSAEKREFKALQYGILKIELDTAHANEATICFRCGMPLSLIGTVQVFTSIGTINF